MALSKADVNNINVTAVASKAIQWNSAADGFEVGTLGGSMVLLTTATASGSANLTFDSSIDSTFDSYVFKFINIHPSASASFTVNFRDGSTAYDATKTTSYFRAYHQENAGGVGIDIIEPNARSPLSHICTWLVSPVIAASSVPVASSAYHKLISGSPPVGASIQVSLPLKTVPLTAAVIWPICELAVAAFPIISPLPELAKPVRSIKILVWKMFPNFWTSAL